MNKPSLLLFGAGKIGRSFIAQLFNQGGWEVIFVDMDQKLVALLNARKAYPIVIKAPEKEESILVSNIRAIDARALSEVLTAIRDADLMAISVGKTALPVLAPVIAQGLELRESHRPGKGLDIILAENMRSAPPFFRERLLRYLSPEYPLDTRVGLVETSIGKMVPIMTRADLKEDPLQVFAEPYNTLILDRKGFRGPVPDIPGLALKDHMKAWVDRKAFIHNLGHATAAYKGHREHPEATYLYEVLQDPRVKDFTYRVMQEAASTLLKAYPGEFTRHDLEEHIQDLLLRFQNRNLGDTIYRIGSDLRRKLGPDDRFLGAIRLAQLHQQAYGLILEALALGMSFQATDEKGALFPGDDEFHQLWESDPDRVFPEIMGLDPVKDAALIDLIKKHTS